MSASRPIASPSDGTAGPHRRVAARRRCALAALLDCWHAHLGAAARQPLVGRRCDRSGDRAGCGAANVRQLELRMVLFQIPARLAVPHGRRRSRRIWRSCTSPAGGVTRRRSIRTASPIRSATLFVLAMIGRLLAVLFGVGAGRLGVRHRAAARSTAVRRAGAAFLVATAYPIVYYAHTTNLDISYCFWLILALYAAHRRLRQRRAGCRGRRSASPRRWRCRPRSRASPGCCPCRSWRWLGACGRPAACESAGSRPPGSWPARDW